MTSLPDWLVERAALDEVAPESRDRLERADRDELATRIAALRDDNAAELAAYPAGPAVAQIDARVAAAKKRRRQRHIGLLAAAVGAAAALVLFVSIDSKPAAAPEQEDGIRVKGNPRLLAFRLVDGKPGTKIEQLEPDALVNEGDLIQLRYNGGGRAHGVIASIDGAGVVTLHFPAAENAPTALAPRTTALPNSYALDDAPRFERFFIITADTPISVSDTLASLRQLAQRDDSADAVPDLRAGQTQWSLRLRKSEDRHD